MSEDYRIPDGRSSRCFIKGSLVLDGEFNLLSHVRTVYSIMLYSFKIVLLYYNNNRHMLSIKLIFFINEHMLFYFKKFHLNAENICHRNCNLDSFIYFCFTFLLFSFQIFFMIYFYFMWILMLIFRYIFLNTCKAYIH